MKNVNHTKNVNANGVHESHLAKKNDLKIERSPLLRFSVSLMLSLFIVYTIFQVRTTEAIEQAPELVDVLDDTTPHAPIFQEEIVVVKEPQPEPEVQSSIIYNEVKPVDNDTKTKEEVLKVSKEPVEVPEDFDPNSVEVEDTPEEVEEVPFAFIEDAPIYPGCEKFKDNRKELKKCMSEKIQKHVNRKFNADLAQELNLDEGRQRIDVLFMIDENGNVTGIKSRAPHPKLQKEAERVIRLLPKMIPGKQREQNVKVKYTLPIIFRVD